jgi:uncharacterized protein (TIGR03067 family)
LARIEKNQKKAIGAFDLIKDMQFFSREELIGSIKLVPNTKPKQFELTTKPGSKITGIYKVSENVLIMCWDAGGKVVPTEFKTTTSDPFSLRVWTLEGISTGDDKK